MVRPGTGRQVPQNLAGCPFAPWGIEPPACIPLHDPGEPVVVGDHLARFEQSGARQPGEGRFGLRCRRWKRHDRRLAGAPPAPEPVGGGEQDRQPERQQADLPPARRHAQLEGPSEVMDVSPGLLRVGRQRRNHPHRRRQRLDERKLAVRRPDSNGNPGDLMVAGEHERAELEPEPALPRPVVVPFQRRRTHHPEAAEAFLDHRGNLRACGMLHDDLQLEDRTDLYRLGDHFGQGAGNRHRAALAGSAAAERGDRDREERGSGQRCSFHRRRLSRIRKNFRSGAS